jgi:lysyl-tRNA synthetase class 2
MRAKGIEPYPTRTEVNQTVAEAIDKFKLAETEGQTSISGVVLAGRIRASRIMGKLAFVHIEDGSGRIQLFLRVNELGEEAMDLFKEFFDLGDYIQASGDVVRTRTGEISLQVLEFKMLAKSLPPCRPPRMKSWTACCGRMPR